MYNNSKIFYFNENKIFPNNLLLFNYVIIILFNICLNNKFYNYL